MGAAFRSLRENTQIGRHSIVTAVLVCFALIVAVVTLMVLTAIGRVADYSNKLDDERSWETTVGALKTFQGQLEATLHDHSARNDAARSVYGTDNQNWIVGNYGDISSNGALFDTAVIVEDNNKPIVAYHDGQPLTGSIEEVLGTAVWALVDQARTTRVTGVPEASSYIMTRDGIAAAGAATIRERSGRIPVPEGHRRYLILVRYLDANRIKMLSNTYVISGLRLVPPETVARYAVSIVDPLGKSLGRLVWSSRQPGDMSYQQVRPLVLGALGLVGLFFVVLLILGLMAGRRLRAEEVQARQVSLRDRLSGLLNREGLRLDVDRLVDRARSDGTNVLLLYLDLDGFKEINDAYGHGTGDQLIRAVAAGLKVLVPPQAALARLGGDEFAIAFPTKELNDAPALRLAEQILDFLAEPLEIGRRVVVVGASIGIASSPEGRIDREELVRRADLAMYKAKEAGRARMTCYDTAMDAHREERNALELDLRRAIELEELTLAYQPLVDASSCEMIGVEALVRWNRPGHGPISPEAFIPIAETSGLIEALGLLVLRKACEAARHWPDLRVAVNVSPGQFRNPAFADYVRSVLNSTEIEAERVTLEITEGYIIQNPERTRQSIERLKRLGVKVALDDFGSGFSSIGYLRQFGFDRIKIDRSLTMNVLEDNRAREMVKATVALARSLDIPVTAEGIETEEQGRALAGFGCDELQGYFHGKPMPEAEISKRLAVQTATAPDEEHAAA
ncbi:MULTISPECIES: putative bifunctional diguanylate cyclase/phosphodiesterase [Rhizobium]|uniref:Diguanylate cyclase (GGDEF)-like protein n=1 Tax=Rhizobium tropici TaxID=398 RepID=A0A6P1C8M7_RHITR|nr:MULTISPECIES: EAL domain-containing protein [Rhizobium]AGB72477.1 GGDEF domain-containing protein [Rhizobium tropici CIAT 899]MBB4243286.1 diguanylate cyclase (GGDEF)-like protein [Rhizobium tropici]MBB5594929.1 diguanylate cyclase (GGDEF)-like protein [Rhizobium tropici]MBB6493612.1 diguanylate cyclase (GGDEF)-like protein [Rhizobium tropici]NEV13579.1 EAL domain-containing protein [Rhizobium tropici]